MIAASASLEARARCTARAGVELVLHAGAAERQHHPLDARGIHGAEAHVAGIAIRSRTACEYSSCQKGVGGIASFIEGRT
jgi:hypothetical protein